MPKDRATSYPRWPTFFARDGFPRQYKSYIGPLPTAFVLVLLATPLAITGALLLALSTGAAALAWGTVCVCLAAPLFIHGAIALFSSANKHASNDPIDAADTDTAPPQSAGFSPENQPSQQDTENLVAKSNAAPNNAHKPR
ncbi:MAG: hypothetical protein V4490_02550 [Pseudomonadota bacterium]